MGVARDLHRRCIYFILEMVCYSKLGSTSLCPCLTLVHRNCVGNMCHNSRIALFQSHHLVFLLPLHKLGMEFVGLVYFLVRNKVL